MRAAEPFLALTEGLKVHFLVSAACLAAGLPTPPASSAAILFLAYGTGRILGSLGGPVLFHALARLAAFSAAFLGFSVFAEYPPLPELSTVLADGTGWVRPTAALACLGLHGLRGSWLERRKSDHAFFVARFDEGIGVFLVILSIAALVGGELDRPAASALPFLAFSILGLGLARREGDDPGAFSRRSALASLLAVSVLFLGAAAGLALLMPLLTEPAARAGEALAEAAPAVLRFIGRLLGRIYRLETAAPRLSEGGSGILPGETGDPEGGTLTGIFVAVLGGIAALSAAALVVAALVRLVRRLASPAERRSRPPDLSFLARWLSGIPAALRRVLARLGTLRSRRASSPALRAYARLVSVGRLVGLARNRDETPREYARRLASAFPRNAAEAEFVVDRMEREVYGGKPRDPDADRRLAAARRGTRVSGYLMERLGSARDSRSPGRNSTTGVRSSMRSRMDDR